MYSGAERTIISMELAKTLQLVIRPEAGTISGYSHDFTVPRIGTVEISSLRIQGRCISLRAEVCCVPRGVAPMLIGRDILEQLGFRIVVPTAFPDKEIARQVTATVERLELAFMSMKDYVPSAEDIVSHDRAMKVLDEEIQSNLKLDGSEACNVDGSTVKIKLRDPGKPNFTRQYPIPQSVRDIVRERKDEWLEKGYIGTAPVGCPHNNAITTSPKKDDEGNKVDTRVCMDLRALNLRIDDAEHPIPTMADFSDKLEGATYFTSLDAKECYHQFLFDKSSRDLTAFTVDGHKYVWLRGMFGLKVIGITMQCVMAGILKDMDDALVYIDDILIATKGTWEEHIERVRLAIRKLTAANIRLKWSKCRIATKEGRLMGHIMSTQGVRADPMKVRAIYNYPTPKNGSELARFLGMVGWMRRHTRFMSNVTSPLEALKNKKGAEYQWLEEHAVAFKTIQQAIASMSMIYHPDYKKDFYVATDASSNGLGAYIYQYDEGGYDEDGKKNVIAYASRGLTPHELNYSTIKKELLALIYALDKFHIYIYGRSFTVLTDHKALTYMHSQKGGNTMANTWYETLGNYTFDVVHHPGYRNIVPDTLSRIYAGQAWGLVDVPYDPEEGYTGFHQMGTSIKKSRVHLHQTEIINERWTNERAIASGKRIPETDERERLVSDAHTMGHFGREATFERLLNTNNVWWNTMREDCSQCVNKCMPCLRFNIAAAGYHPARSSAHKAERPFDHVGIDLLSFSETLTEGYTCVLVLVDVLSKSSSSDRCTTNQ